MSVCMNADFVPQRPHHILHYVLQTLNRELGAIEFMKIIYLIDVSYWRLFGRTLTGTSYFRHKRGPYSDAVNQALLDMEGYEVACRICPSRGASEYSKKARRLGSAPRFQPCLSEEEKAVVRETLSQIGTKSPRELEQLAYSTEPMQDTVSREQASGKSLILQPLDLRLLTRDAFMEQWLRNREEATKSPADETYDEYLSTERLQVAQLLADT